ncbi:MAG: hypothetical protein JJE35_07025 [Thermoleophilia bacterium]|nr:hypothetical protein [Thermoleophilia bacterium]
MLAVVIYRLPTHRKLGDVPTGWVVSRWALRGIGTVPFLIGAVSVIAGSGGGLYWVVVGIVLAIVAAVANAWVLLVEILR